MKRIVSLVLCMALALGAVTYKPPQAKALALETYGIVSLVGLFLTSMGLTWAYDNYQSAVADAPVTKFGSNLAEDLQGWLDETQSGKVIDVFFGDKMPNLSPTPGSNGGIVVIAGAAFTAAVASFGKWLYDKYALAENESAVVYSDPGSLLMADGSYTKLSSWDGHSTTLSLTGTVFSDLGDYIFADGTIVRIKSDGAYYYFSGGSTSYSPLKNLPLAFFEYDNCLWSVHLNGGSSVSIGVNMLSNGFKYSNDTAYDFSVSAPNGLNLPDTDALPEGQGYVLELPETNGAPIQDLNDLLNYVVPLAVNNPEYVPTLNPSEITNPDPTPTPDGEEAPEPAPAGATIIDYLVDIWRKIKALPETIGNGIKKAFEPDPELVTEITTTFTDKFGWLETIHQLGLDLCGLKPGSEPPVIFIHLEDATGKYNYGGTEKALDMSWYEPYKEDVDNIISGFMWLAFLWLVFKRAADIINGAGMVSDYEFYGSHPIDQPRLEEHKK